MVKTKVWYSTLRVESGGQFNLEGILRVAMEKREYLDNYFVFFFILVKWLTLIVGKVH